MSFFRMKALYGLLALLSSLLLVSQFLSEDYLRGVDAYYYAVQADTWFHTGRLRIPDHSLLHYLIGLLQYTGLDAGNAFRFWLGISVLLFALAYLALQRPWLSGRKGFFLFLWVLLSPSLLFCALEFPKTFAFLVVCTLWLYAIQEERWPLLLVLLPLGCAMHRMALVYAVAVLGWLTLNSLHKPSASVKRLARRYLRRRTPRARARLPGRKAGRPENALASGSGPAPGREPMEGQVSKSPGGCFQVPLLSGIRGKRLYILSAIFAALIGLWLWLSGGLELGGRLSAKGSSMVPGLAALFMEPNLPLSIRIEFVLTACVMLCFLIGRKRDFKTVSLLLCMVLPSFTPSLGEESFSLGERFGLLFPYAVMLCLSFSQRQAAEAEAARDPAAGSHDEAAGEDGESRPGRPAGLLWLLAPPLVLAALFFRLYAAHPEQVNPDYERFALLTDDLARMDIPMLILHRGMHFYYKYSTGRDAFSYEPEKHWPKERIWRLVYGVSPSELFAYMPGKCGWNTGSVLLLRDPLYNLVREDCYVGLRGAVSRERNPQLHALLWENPMNPSVGRPSFLYGKHAGETDQGEFPALPPHPNAARSGE